MPNEFAEVLVSEQTAVSVKVTVAPQLAGGLAALAAKHLSAAAPEPPPKERSQARTTISNKLIGDVHGTVFQIGTVKNLNTPDGR